MRLSEFNIKKICKNKGLTLTEVLKKSGVSRTAYYSLIRKETIVAKSVSQIAKYLNVPTTDLLFDETLEIENYRNRISEVNEIAAWEENH